MQELAGIGRARAVRNYLAQFQQAVGGSRAFAQLVQSAVEMSDPEIPVTEDNAEQADRELMSASIPHRKDDEVG